MRLVLVAIGIYMIWGYSALAKNVTVAQRPNIEKRLSFDFDLSAASNLKSTADSDYEATTSMALIAGYKLTTLIHVSALIGIYKKLYGEQESELANTEIYLKPNPIQFLDGRAISFAIVGVLPTNEKDRLEKTFQGATGASVGLTQKYTIGLKPGSVGYTLSGLKNYHEFDRTNVDEANLSYRFRHALAVEQDLFNAVSIELLTRYQLGYTYQNAMKTAFLIQEKINFLIDKTLTLYLGHSNDGDALKPDGVETNIKAYDKATSTFTTGLIASF